jgi:hypothetical protein
MSSLLQILIIILVVIIAIILLNQATKNGMSGGAPVIKINKDTMANEYVGILKKAFLYDESMPKIRKIDMYFIDKLVPKDEKGVYHEKQFKYDTHMESVKEMKKELEAWWKKMKERVNDWKDEIAKYYSDPDKAIKDTRVEKYEKLADDGFRQDFEQVVHRRPSDGRWSYNSTLDKYSNELSFYNLPYGRYDRIDGVYEMTKDPVMSVKFIGIANIDPALKNITMGKLKEIKYYDIPGSDIQILSALEYVQQITGINDDVTAAEAVKRATVKLKEANGESKDEIRQNLLIFLLGLYFGRKSRRERISDKFHGREVRSAPSAGLHSTSSGPGTGTMVATTAIATEGFSDCTIL